MIQFGVETRMFFREITEIIGNALNLIGIGLILIAVAIIIASIIYKSKK